MTPATKLVLNRSLATIVYSASSVIVVNLVDPAHQIYTWPWLKHLLIAWAGTTVVLEARYWRTWAGQVLGLGGNNGNNPVNPGP